MPGLTHCRALPGWARGYLSGYRLVHGLRVIDYDSALLMHSIEMMNRSNAPPERMGVHDCGGYIRFRQQNGLR